MVHVNKAPYDEALFSIIKLAYLEIARVGGAVVREPLEGQVRARPCKAECSCAMLASPVSVPAAPPAPSVPPPVPKVACALSLPQIPYPCQAAHLRRGRAGAPGAAPPAPGTAWWRCHWPSHR